MPQTPRFAHGSSPAENVQVAPSAEREAEAGSRVSPGTHGFVRNSVFGTVAGVGTALGSVLGSVIVAHSLGVERTGVVAFALWVVTVAAAVADLGVQSSLARYLPELLAGGRGGEAGRLAAVLWRPVAVTAGLAVFGFTAYALWRRGETALWLLVGLGCALQTLAGFTYGRLRGEQRFDRVALVTIASIALQLVGIVIGSILFGVPGALAGYCAGNALPAVLSLRASVQSGGPAPEIRRRVMRYALYAWAAALSSTIVWSRAEVFFLQRSAGSAAVGLFSVGVTSANIAAQGPMLLTAALLPHFAQSFGKGTVAEMHSAYAAATRVLAFLVFPACFGLAAVLPSVLPLMYGNSFAGAIPAATVLVLAAGIGATSSVGASLIMAMDRSDFVFISGLLAAALTVVAGFTIIPAFGLMGAAWSRAVIQASAVAFGSWFLLYRLRVPLPLNSLGKLLVAAACCGGTARLCLELVPGKLALPAAIIAGALVYVAAVRTVRALPASDLDRLHGMVRMLPRPLQRAFGAALRLLGEAPAARSGSTVFAPRGVTAMAGMPEARDGD